MRSQSRLGTSRLVVAGIARLRRTHSNTCDGLCVLCVFAVNSGEPLRYTFASMNVLALDFDGVVCDSLREVFATASGDLRIHGARVSAVLARICAHGSGAGRWHEARISLNDPVMVSFESMMPLGNRAEDFGVSLRALDSFLELTDQECVRHLLPHRRAPEWLAAFHRGLLRAARRGARVRHPRLAGAATHSYPAFLEMLRRRSRRRPDRPGHRQGSALGRAAARPPRCRRPLRPGAVARQGDRGFRRRPTSRRSGIASMSSFDEITFVDDKLNHLETVAPLGVRPILAGWGFNTPEGARSRRPKKASTVANFDDVERVLYGGGSDAID